MLGNRGTAPQRSRGRHGVVEQQLVWQSLNTIAYAIARRSPLLSRVWRHWRIARERVETRLRFMRGHHDGFLVPNRIISVAPSRIHRIARPDAVRGYRLMPTMISGDWDFTGPLTDGSGFYDDLRAVAAGAGWDSTHVYASALECFVRGEPWKGLMDRRQFEREWCAEYDRLLESIRTDGYMSQSQLPRAKPRGYIPLLPDEVTVAIGRDGSLLVWEGRHRVACATVLGVEEIPARVAFRHANWAAFRRSIDVYARKHGGMIPQPLLHPDLDNIPAWRDCRTEFARVRSALGSRHGTLVDLTPGWGYFCHRFEQVGSACTAVVDGTEDARFMRAHRQAQERTFDVIAAGDSGPRRSFDAALALDWMGRGDDETAEVEKLLELLGSVSVAELVVEMPRRADTRYDRPAAERQGGLLSTLAEKGGFSSWSLVYSRDSRSDVYRLAGGRAR